MCARLVYSASLIIGTICMSTCVLCVHCMSNPRAMSPDEVTVCGQSQSIAADRVPAPTSQSAGGHATQISANQPQSASTNQTGGLIQSSKTVQGVGTGSIAIIMAGLVIISYLKRSPRDRESIESAMYRRMRKRATA